MRWERARQEGMGALHREPRATDRGTAPGVGATAQRRGTGGRLSEGAGDVAADRATDRSEFPVKILASSAWRLLGGLGWSVRRPAGEARDSNDRAARRRKARRWPEQKNAARDGRIILCIDEGGLSCRPCGAGPWAPGGQTPILQYSFSREQLSVIADLSYWRFCFRLFSGALKSPQFVESLQALQATTGKNLPAIWDRLRASLEGRTQEHRGSARPDRDRLPAAVRAGSAPAAVRGGSADALGLAAVTYVPTDEGTLYPVLDVFSRYAVGWAMAARLGSHLVRTALAVAYAQRRPKRTIHHSDHGSEYTAVAFSSRCRGLGITMSMGSVGDCFDNAMMQSCF